LSDIKVSMSLRKDQELFKKIEAIYKVNNEIILRIKSKTEVITGYSYKVVEDQYQFKVIETREEEKVSDLLNIWKPEAKLKVIEDFFKDKLNYKCCSFDDIVHLNNTMLPVVLQYRLFGGSQEAVDIITQFMENFEIIQVCLGSLEENLTDAKPNLQDLQEKVDQVNEQVKNVIIVAEKNSTSNEYWKKAKEESKRIDWWQEKCSRSIIIHGKFAVFTGLSWCALLCNQQNPSHSKIKVHNLGKLEIGFKMFIPICH